MIFAAVSASGQAHGSGASVPEVRHNGQSPMPCAPSFARVLSRVIKPMGGIGRILPCRRPATACQLALESKSNTNDEDDQSRPEEGETQS